MVLGISVLDLFKVGTRAAGLLPRPGANLKGGIKKRKEDGQK